MADLSPKNLEAKTKQLREAIRRLEHALDEIDCVMMPPEEIVRDIAAVGAPVSPYSVDYDEEAVVNRVRSKVSECLELRDRLKEDKDD